MGLEKKLQFCVTKEEEGISLLSFLRKRFASLGKKGTIKEQYTVRFFKRSIEKKCCRINGKVELFSTHPLRAKDKVELSLSQAKALENKKAAPLKVIHEEEGFLVCNKPVGVVVDLKLIVFEHTPIYLVHRLDKETSGILLLAKTKEAADALIEQFAKRKVKKLYLAIVDGNVHKKQGRKESFLAKKRTFQGQSIYGSTRQGGRRSITKWYCLKRTKNASLLLCQPITGRTHQLRVHFKEMRHPILGDYHYSQNFRSPFHSSRHLLHAYQLSFIHPDSGEEVTYKASPPRDFYGAQKALRLDISEKNYRDFEFVDD